LVLDRLASSVERQRVASEPPDRAVAQRVAAHRVVVVAALGAALAAVLARGALGLPLAVGLAAALAFHAAFAGLFTRQLVSSARTLVGGHGVVFVFALALGVVTGFLTMAEGVRVEKDRARAEQLKQQEQLDP
jgi:hypothetical protein